MAALAEQQAQMQKLMAKLAEEEAAAAAAAVATPAPVPVPVPVPPVPMSPAEELAALQAQLNAL